MVPLDPEPWPIDHLPLRGESSAIALEDKAGSVDFAGLEQLVGAVAGWLSTLGLRQGDRVASWLPKTRASVILPLAVARAGLVHVPVNPLLKRGQVAHILADSGAALLITQGSRSATLLSDDVPAHCHVVMEDAIWGAKVHLPPSDADPGSLAAILYTSGSTGRPKGVMLSHANLWLGAVSVAHYLRLDPDDRVVAVLPFSFDYGQNQMFSTWAAGARVIPVDYLTPRDVIKAVERFGANTLAGVPPLWQQLVESDWPASAATLLKTITNSGGALSRRLVEALRATFPMAKIYPMYGLTEAFRSTYLAPELVDSNPESIGRAIPFAEILVVRPDGQQARPGEPGELVHAGPLVAQGYWRDAKRTAERFRPAPSFSQSGGIAVWSGDTVVCGRDGLFRFIGRDDEMIKSAGNRISPSDIEEAILSGGEAAEVVAIGVADERMGQVIAVVARAVGDAGLAEQALRERLRRDLPNFMQPDRYHWRDALPRNANGKIDRAALKRELTR